MKIAIKKIYITALVAFTSLVTGYSLLTDLIRYIGTYGLDSLTLPVIFISTSIYVLIWWNNSKMKIASAKETAKEIYPNDPLKEKDLCQHLLHKIEEDAWTINFFKRKFYFSSSWMEQKKFEEQKYVPEIIRKEIDER